MTDAERAVALAALEAYEAWEADVILNGDWSGEAPTLTQEQVDRLVAIQQLRNAALDRLRLLAEQSAPSPANLREVVAKQIDPAAFIENPMMVMQPRRAQTDALKTAGAALSAISARGLVILPREPTKAMVEAACRAMVSSDDAWINAPEPEKTEARESMRNALRSALAAKETSK